MGMVEQAIVIGVGMDRAIDEWNEYTYREQIGRGRGPQGDVESGEEDTEAAERVTFEELGPGSTRMVLHAEYDEGDADVDISGLRADANDELARFREFVEGRLAA